MRNVKKSACRGWSEYRANYGSQEEKVSTKPELLILFSTRPVPDENRTRMERLFVSVNGNRSRCVLDREWASCKAHVRYVRPNVPSQGVSFASISSLK